MYTLAVGCAVILGFLLGMWFFRQKKTVSKHDCSELSGNLHIIPLTKMEQMVKLLTWFPKGDPLSEALGIDSDEWVRLGKAMGTRCVGNGISFVAVVNGEIVGGIVLEKCGQPPPDIQLSENMMIGMTLLDEVEKKPLEMFAKKNKDLYKVVFAVVDPAFRNNGVLFALGRHLINVWRECVIFTSTASEYSRRVAISNGMTEACIIKYDTWEHAGKHPLACVKQPHTCVSCLYMEIPLSCGAFANLIYQRVRKFVRDLVK